MTRYETLAANIESRGTSPDLRALIREHQPDLVVVEQAMRARQFLRSIPGYTAQQFAPEPSGLLHPPPPEWHGVALLIRNGVNPHHAAKALVMDRRWRGPKNKGGRLHGPRVYPAVPVSKRDDPVRLIGIHFPSGGPDGPNAAAWWESARAIRRYFETHPNSPVIAVGDYNASAGELRAAIRGWPGVDLLTSGAKVDHALVRGFEKSHARRVPTPAGAHGWALYTTLTKENR